MGKYQIKGSFKLRDDDDELRELVIKILEREAEGSYTISFGLKQVIFLMRQRVLCFIVGRISRFYRIFSRQIPSRTQETAKLKRKEDYKTKKKGKLKRRAMKKD